jgi:DNA-binding IclR family transcriptional regulator
LAEDAVDEKKLAQRLRRIRETGYLIAPSHDIAGITDICAPILDQSERALAGIVIPCLKRTKSVDRHEDIAQALLAACAAISAALRQTA